MALPMIYINSWPGVGKHTIARELEKQMEGKARVVRNHLHIDLAGAILPRTSADYLDLRHQLRSALFDTLATSPDTFGHIYIFTDFQTTNESGVSVATEYLSAARARSCTFIPIILTCRAAENERRMRSRERLELAERGTGLLLDTHVLRAFREKAEIYSFGAAEELVLDVEGITAAQAAERIGRHVRLVMGGGWGGMMRGGEEGTGEGAGGVRG